MSGMNIKKGDKVKVLSGKDKGKEGVVLRALPQKERVVVEKVNMIKKAMRPTQQNPQGGISTMEAPIHVSNVMVICPECKQPTRRARSATRTARRSASARSAARTSTNSKPAGAARRHGAQRGNRMNMTPAPPGTPGRKSCV